MLKAFSWTDGADEERKVTGNFVQDSFMEGFGL